MASPLFVVLSDRLPKVLWRFQLVTLLSKIAGHLQGLFTTMVRNVPANAVYLGTFEVLKNKAANYKQVSIPDLPAGYVLGSAALGGILYWCAIYPVDVCKSAIMTVSLSAPPSFVTIC